MDVPLEHEPWIASVVDIEYACDQMRQSGIFEDEFVELMRDTYGEQRQPYDGTQTFLNLWAWFANITGQREKFIRSLAPKNDKDPYLQPEGLGRHLAITSKRFAEGVQVTWSTVITVGDCKHPLNRLYLGAKHIWRYQGYPACSAVYSLFRRFLGLGPWRDILNRR